MGAVVIYPCHNRLEYTKITLPRVIDECRNSNHFEFLYIYNDNSVDGTKEYLESIEFDKCRKYHEVWGNSVACINKTIKGEPDVEYLIKIDNDIIIPEGYIDYLYKRMDELEDINFLAFKECQGLPSLPSMDIDIEPASHIGGVGIFRRSVFDKPIESARRYFGFTKYQQDRGGAAWVENGFNTNLDCSCWSRQKAYFEKGWARTGLVGDERSVF